MGQIQGITEEVSPSWVDQVDADLHFYTGLNAHIRQMIDTSAGGIFLKRTTQQAFDLLDGITTNSYQWSQERMVKGNRNNGVSTDVFSNLAAQVSLLTKQL